MRIIRRIKSLKSEELISQSKGSAMIMKRATNDHFFLQGLMVLSLTPRSSQGPEKKVVIGRLSDLPGSIQKERRLSRAV